MLKSYPFKYISHVIIGLALGAVLVETSLVEAFRSTPAMLYLAYVAIMVILVIVYMQIEPLFLFILRRRSTDKSPLVFCFSHSNISAKPIDKQEKMNTVVVEQLLNR